MKLFIVMKMMIQILVNNIIINNKYLHYIFKIIFILDMVSHVSASSDGGSTTISSRIRPNMNIDVRQWREDDNVIDDFVFNPHDTNAGINSDLFDTLMHGTPLDFYTLIVNDEIINKIVIETNKFAAQQKASKSLSPFARINKWFDTDETEIKQLFGLA